MLSWGEMQPLWEAINPIRLADDVLFATRSIVGQWITRAARVHLERSLLLLLFLPQVRPAAKKALVASFESFVCFSTPKNGYNVERKWKERLYFACAVFDVFTPRYLRRRNLVDRSPSIKDTRKGATTQREEPRWRWREIQLDGKILSLKKMKTPPVFFLRRMADWAFLFGLRIASKNIPFFKYTGAFPSIDEDRKARWWTSSVAALHSLRMTGN